MLFDLRPCSVSVEIDKDFIVKNYTQNYHQTQATIVKSRPWGHLHTLKLVHSCDLAQPIKLTPIYSNPIFHMIVAKRIKTETDTLNKVAKTDCSVSALLVPSIVLPQLRSKRELNYADFYTEVLNMYPATV